MAKSLLILCRKMERANVLLVSQWHQSGSYHTFECIRFFANHWTQIKEIKTKQKETNKYNVNVMFIAESTAQHTNTPAHTDTLYIIYIYRYLREERNRLEHFVLAHRNMITSILYMHIINIHINQNFLLFYSFDLSLRFEWLR